MGWRGPWMSASWGSTPEVRTTPRVPFAGLKDSGIGVEGGFGGLEVFLASQTIAVSGR